MENIGKGVSYEIDNEGIMTIKVDTTEDFGPSASGKSIIIASSSGNAKINIGNEESGDQIVSLGLNI